MLRTERLLGILSGAFGAVALTLSAIGLGGLLVYGVARRTNEIGVRIALGRPSDIVRMVVRDSIRMVGVGVVIGLPCAYAIGKVLETALFRIEPLDPRTAALSLAVLLAVALVAAWVPARRASRIDPVIAFERNSGGIRDRGSGIGDRGSEESRGAKAPRQNRCSSVPGLPDLGPLIPDPDTLPIDIRYVGCKLLIDSL